MALDTLFELSRHFIRRKSRPYVREFLNTPALDARFCIVTGQRGVGKTTALIQYIEKHFPDALSSRKVLYIPCDHFKLQSRPLYDIAEEFVHQNGALLCVDEIHKMPDWSTTLKSMYETFPELKVLASGSSALRIRQGAQDLARRTLFTHLPGLSLREFAELSLGIELGRIQLEQVYRDHESLVPPLLRTIEAAGEKILSLFQRYMRVGYYPYYREFGDTATFWDALQQDIHTTIEMDLLAVHGELTGNTIRKVRKLLAVVSESVPFTPDLAKLKRLVEVRDDRTLKIYLSYLEDAGLIRQLTKGKHTLRQLAKPEKLYLDNTNQIYALSRDAHQQSGNLRETFFASMLRSAGHELAVADRGDFLVDGKTTAEVGGAGKGFAQISNMPDSYLFVDDIELGGPNRIPLWVAGFLY